MSIVRQQRPVVGILWMLVTGVLFVAVTALVKYLGPRIPAPEAAFLRYLLGFIILIPALRPMMRARLSRRLHMLFGLRGLMHSIGVMMWFFAMARIPIAEVTAINYLVPIGVSVGAAVFLGETLAARRIAAVVIALIGALIILRPGIRAVTTGDLAMLVAAVVFSGSYLLAKVLADEVNPGIVVAMLSVWVTLALAPFAAMVWVAPTWAEIGILTGVAFFATAGHYTMTLALAVAPVTVTQPVTFVQLVWATVLGVVMFDEAVDVWVVVGGGVIIAAVSFITWREAVLKRRAITPPASATGV